MNKSTEDVNTRSSSSVENSIFVTTIVMVECHEPMMLIRQQFNLGNVVCVYE